MKLFIIYFINKSNYNNQLIMGASSSINSNANAIYLCYHSKYSEYADNIYNTLIQNNLCVIKFLTSEIDLKNNDIDHCISNCKFIIFITDKLSLISDYIQIKQMNAIFDNNINTIFITDDFNQLSNIFKDRLNVSIFQYSINDTVESTYNKIANVI